VVDEFTSSGVFELSNLDANSVVFVLNQGDMDGNAPITNHPITTPNVKAMMKPEANHPNLREGG
jgi:hypothetical protein